MQVITDNIKITKSKNLEYYHNYSKHILIPTSNDYDIKINK